MRRLCVFVVGGVCEGSPFAIDALEENPSSSQNLTKKPLKKAEGARKLADKARWRVYNQGNAIPKTRAKLSEPPQRSLPPSEPLTEEDLQALSDRAERLLTPAPDYSATLPAGDELRHVVGYDSSTDPGEASDYESLDALLDHYEGLLRRKEAGR
jgi:hypothetical protein